MTSRDERRWEGEVAADSDLDEHRHWVVWGRGAPPEGVFPDAEIGTDIARMMVEGVDPEWDEGWILIVEADEDDIDAAVQDEESVLGYAPYLIEREAAGSRPTAMRGRLRSDRVKRRPFDLGKRR